MRQRFSIQLSARVQRELGEHHHRRRHHVRRQGATDEATYLRRVQRPTRCRHDVADELITGTGSGHHRRGLVDVGVRQQCGLDFTELYPLAAELDLEVRAPDVLEHPLVRSARSPSDEVAGAVHALARGRERVRDESVHRQVDAAEIAVGELRARQVQLARGARGHRVQPAVEDVGLGVPFRSTDRDGHAVVGGGLPIRHRHSGFGGAVQVVDRGRGDRPEVLHRLRGQSFAHHVDVSEGTTLLRGGVRGEHGQHRRHEVRDGDAVPGDPGRDVRRVAVAVGGCENDTRTDLEWEEEPPQ